jgi:hypothetical protein
VCLTENILCDAVEVLSKETSRGLPAANWIKPEDIQIDEFVDNIAAMVYNAEWSNSATSLVALASNLQSLG